MNLNLIRADELERLVRATFPGKGQFSVESALASRAGGPAVAFVHGGPDPFLDRQFDDWIAGAAAYVQLYQLLNRLCRAGALAPGTYAVTRARRESRSADAISTLAH